MKFSSFVRSLTRLGTAIANDGPFISREIGMVGSCEQPTKAQLLSVALCIANLV